MSAETKMFKFECGIHRGTVEASTLGEAWRKLTDGKITGFAQLARFKTWGDERILGRIVWQYIEPSSLDEMR